MTDLYSYYALHQNLCSCELTIQRSICREDLKMTNVSTSQFRIGLNNRIFTVNPTDNGNIKFKFAILIKNYALYSDYPATHNLLC